MIKNVEEYMRVKTKMKDTLVAPYWLALAGLEVVKIDIAPMIHMQAL